MPKIILKCKNCKTKYTVGDFLPPTKQKCPKCGICGNNPDYNDKDQTWNKFNVSSVFPSTADNIEIDGKGDDVK